MTKFTNDIIAIKAIIKKHFFTHPRWVIKSQKICIVPEVIDAISGESDDHVVKNEGQFIFIRRQHFQDPHFIVDRSDGKMWIPFWNRKNEREQRHG